MDGRFVGLEESSKYLLFLEFGMEIEHQIDRSVRFDFPITNMGAAPVPARELPLSILELVPAGLDRLIVFVLAATEKDCVRIRVGDSNVNYPVFNFFNSFD